MVELAVILSLFAVIAARLMMETVTASAVNAQQITISRLQEIEESLRIYYRVWYHLPCPAPSDTSPLDTAYGTAQGAQGDCVPSGATMFGPVNDVVAGDVPVKDLGLPDEYILDGWGRKFSYVLDERYSMTLESRTYTPAIEVNSYNTVGVLEPIYYPVVLISFGKHGHGAYPSTGSATRISSFTANTDEEENAVMSSAFDEEITRRPFAVNDTASQRFDQLVVPLAF